MTPQEVAVRELGVREMTGRNDGIPARRYMRGDELAWCAGFVLYCFDKSDWPSLFDDEGDGQEDRDDTLRYYAMRNVQQFEDEMRSRGAWFGDSLVDYVLPGDVIFYANRGRSDAGSGRHVGIVVDVEFPARIIRTVEGNLSDEVKRRQVPAGSPQITGFARWTKQVQSCARMSSAR